MRCYRHTADICQKILLAASDSGKITRTQLIAKTHLSRMTVSRAVERLLDTGILAETYEKNNRGHQVGNLSLILPHPTVLLDLTRQVLTAYRFDRRQKLSDKLTVDFDNTLSFEDNVIILENRILNRQWETETLGIIFPTPAESSLPKSVWPDLLRSVQEQLSPASLAVFNIPELLASANAFDTTLLYLRDGNPQIAVLGQKNEFFDIKPSFFKLFEVTDLSSFKEICQKVAAMSDRITICCDAADESFRKNSAEQIINRAKCGYPLYIGLALRRVTRTTIEKISEKAAEPLAFSRRM